jgi:transposase
MGVRVVATRKMHTEEFKREAVRLMVNRGERTVDQVADDVGVTSGQLYRWQGQYGGKASGKPVVTQEELTQENQRLKRENERLRQEREILKKSVAFFVKESG